MNDQNILKKMKDEERLFNYDGAGKIIDSHEAFKKYLENTKRAGQGLRCGIQSLDEKIGEFKPGTLTIISGHTGHGKTLLMCSLINDFIAYGKDCLIFSLEMGLNILSRFRTLPTFYLPDENVESTVQWVREKIHEAKLKHPEIGAVFIDHLGYLETAEHVQNRGNSLLIGDMVRYLSRVAKEFNVCIFLGAHTKDTEFNKDRPSADDIRDSGLIKREADYVLIIWRLLKEDTDPKDKIYTEYSRINLAKQRFTGINHVCKVKWRADLSVFREE
jgi:replicative DNA helicase